MATQTDPSTKLERDAAPLLKLYRQSQELPDLIDAEIVRLIGKGHRQADIARLLGLSPQEISRRVLRRNGT